MKKHHISLGQLRFGLQHTFLYSTPALSRFLTGTLAVIVALKYLPLITAFYQFAECNVRQKTGSIEGCPPH